MNLNDFRRPLSGYRPMVLSQIISKLLVWSFTEWHLLPQVWRQISVGLCNGRVRSLCKVTQCTCWTSGRGVTVFNTRHVQQFLWYWSRYNASTTWGRNETNGYWTTFSCDLQQNLKQVSLDLFCYQKKFNKKNVDYSDLKHHQWVVNSQVETAKVLQIVLSFYVILFWQISFIILCWKTS